MSPPNPAEEPGNAARPSEHGTIMTKGGTAADSASAPDDTHDNSIQGLATTSSDVTKAGMAAPQSSSASDGDLLDLNVPAFAEGSSPRDQEGHNAASDSAEPMSASLATLKPTTPASIPTTKPYDLVLDTTSYVDPTPVTPVGSLPPSRTPSHVASRGRSSDTSPSRPARSASEDEQEIGSQSEIQSIMEQFSEEGGGPGAEEVMSPRLEITSPIFGGPHPPRKSSLEPLAPRIAQQIQEFQGLRLSSSSPASVRSRRDVERGDHAPPVPPKDASPQPQPGQSAWVTDDSVHGVADMPMSPTIALHRPPPPEPEPEPDLPFDFHRFLEQLRNKKADPVARYLKSFLSEFAKRQWMVHEQVKIISDFLAFIANKMAQCEVWRDVSDAEFDNAREGMEKLVMNRLYTQTFSPAIPAPQPLPGAKPKKRGGERPMGPGRRGQHQEDVERDEILAQKINIYGWIREEHLDIPPVGDSGRRFLKLAQQELLKIKSYRAPRDKIICVLNSCKVIFGLLKHKESDSSADSFMPLLIYVVLQSNPEHLVSNVQYILRFRNQEKLAGEAGYYLSSLMGAIQFVENMDRTTLTITDDEFENNVEAAVAAIAEKHRLESPMTSPSQREQPSLNLRPPATGETGSERPSLDMDAPGTPRRSTSSNEGAGEYDEKAAIPSLLRSIQKPLSTIGRMFSEEIAGSSAAGPSSSAAAAAAAEAPPPQLQQQISSPAHTPQPAGSPRVSTDARPLRHTLSAEDAAARQASAEAAEAQRLHRAEHANVVETLAGMFPDLDKEIISDVVYQKEGRVGLAVDACLALSS